MPERAEWLFYFKSGDCSNGAPLFVVTLTGGTGSIVGTAMGVLLIVTLCNGFKPLGVNPFWQQTATGSMIIIATVIDHFNRVRQKA